MSQRTNLSSAERPANARTVPMQCRSRRQPRRPRTPRSLCRHPDAQATAATLTAHSRFQRTGGHVGGRLVVLVDCSSKAVTDRTAAAASWMGGRRRCGDDSLPCLAVPEVRLRRWRMSDLAQIAPMTNDEYLRPWWWLADDLRAWLRREMSEERGPSRAICIADDDRALGRVAVRLPKFASDHRRSDAAVQSSDQPAGELSYWLLPRARGRASRSPPPAR